MSFLKKTYIRLQRYSDPKKLLWRLKVGDKKFVLHEYKNADGSFNYEKYKAIQSNGNHVVGGTKL